MPLKVVCLECVKEVEIVDFVEGQGLVDADKRITWLRCHNKLYLATIPRWYFTSESLHRVTLDSLVQFSKTPTDAAVWACAAVVTAGAQFDFFMRALEAHGDPDKRAPEYAQHLAELVTKNYQLLERLSQRLLALVQRVEQTKK